MGSPEPPGSHLWAQRQWGHSSHTRKQTEKAGRKGTVQAQAGLQGARGHPAWKSVAGGSWLLESKILRISIPKGPLKSPTSLTAQLVLCGEPEACRSLSKATQHRGLGPGPGHSPSRRGFLTRGAKKWTDGPGISVRPSDGVAASREDIIGHNCVSSTMKEQNAWLVMQALTGEVTFLNC